MVYFQINGLTSEVPKILLAILCGVLIRCNVTLHPYSGENQPPLYGDYEAQRHWMEITSNLPVEEWYRNTTDNDLQYWGLDYPPLTAYHSYVMGKISNFFNESFVALHESRGHESKDHKILMRSFVIVSDVAIFFPAIVYYFLAMRKLHKNFSHISDYLFLALLYPGSILIDHGHFQYNCISLGLTVIAVLFIFKNKLLFSTIAFCMALSYKQMSLYHSLPFFIYMLRLIYDEKTKIDSVKLFLKLCISVLITFGVIWYPFWLEIGSLFDVLHRLFPVSRGIFEDKVANFWCAINVIYKLKKLFSVARMVEICAGVTFASSVPSLIRLASMGTKQQFLLSLINVSLSFFLFSFQVHEKSILLVALPVILYAPYDMLSCSYFLAISHFSLLHLAVKDKLTICFFSLTVIFNGFIFYNETICNNMKQKLLFKFTAISSVLGSIVIFAGYLTMKPPNRYPDLWPLVISLFSFVHFFAFFLYFNYVQLFKSEVISKPSKKTKKRRHRVRR